MESHEAGLISSCPQLLLNQKSIWPPPQPLIVSHPLGIAGKKDNQKVRDAPVTMSTT